MKIWKKLQEKGNRKKFQILFSCDRYGKIQKKAYNGVKDISNITVLMKEFINDPSRDI